jgi:hypothetical protein
VNQYRPKYSIRVFQQNRHKAAIAPNFQLGETIVVEANYSDSISKLTLGFIKPKLLEI